MKHQETHDHLSPEGQRHDGWSHGFVLTDSGPPTYGPFVDPGG